MDYDDNDFQGQNLQLAGEGNPQFPPVLRSYALPKFDFDDSLQGHLRFDSLVETEVFLGIQSQEDDNQWIEDFSRGNSGIEFSSSAAENCSIPRRKNVWSEATSSESVEMLLKSVGQEDMNLGQAIIKELDTDMQQGDKVLSMNNPLGDSKSIDENQSEVINSFVPSDKKIHENFSASGMELDAVMTSVKNPATNLEVLNNQEASHQVTHIIYQNSDVSEEDNSGKAAEHHVLGKETCLDDENLKISGIGKQETGFNNLKGSPSKLLKDNSGFLIAESFTGGTTKTGDLCEGNMAEELPSNDGLDRKRDLSESSHSLDPVSLGNPKSSSLPEKGSQLFQGQYDGSNNDVAGDSSNLLPVKTNDTGNVNTVLESRQICQDILLEKGQGGIRNFSSIEKTNIEGPTDISNMDIKIVTPQANEMSVESSSLGEDVLKNEEIVRELQPETTVGSQPETEVATENTKLTSEDNLDGDDAITDEDGKSNSHAFSFDRLEKEEIVSEIPEEAKVSTCKECSQVANKDFEQMPSTEECSTESLNESQAAVANKDTEEFGKDLESCPIPHDSPVKELEGASAVPPEDYKNEKKKDSGEETAAVNAGDPSNKHEEPSSPARVSESDKMCCDSPTVISSTEPSQSEKESHDVVKGSGDEDVPFSEFVQSVSCDPIRTNTTKNDGGFTFEVSSLVDLSERATEKGWKPFPSSQALESSLIAEGPQAAQSSKGTSERKTRRPSKGTGKETAKKASHTKETPTVRQSESNMASLSPSLIAQIVRPDEQLPDLNTSASPSSAFQQPFTDSQQVQLRAQIFVYGSLIQGAVPDEACMVSAFGASDGGRSTWENTWRACVERVHSQKSHSINTETPLQSHSGGRTPDHAIKQGSVQNKTHSSANRPSSKPAPSTVVNSIMPLSSPLWSISTPSLQPSGMLYHQPMSPLHPYQTPPVRNFVGNNTSWLTQPPFPWVAPSQISTVDTSTRFSPLPNTEKVQLTPVKDQPMPAPSVMKDATKPSGQQSTDPKARKRKKTQVSNDQGNISPLPQISRMSQVSIPMPSQPDAMPIVPTHFASVSITTPATKGPSTKVNEMVVFSEESCSIKVKEAKIQAEEAAAHAAEAMKHCHITWNQLTNQSNSGLVSDVEAKLASASMAIAAAASVAKAAAAAAKIASNAALQAKLMADEALVSSNGISISEDMSGNFGKATPMSILKGEGRIDFSSSVLGTAREVARRRVEAASAAAKRAENLDAIVKAAELAAEAVSQAGKIVTMGDPLPLSELIEAGPDGYWKLRQMSSSEPVLESDKMSKEQPANVEKVPDSSVKKIEKGLRGQKGRKVSELAKTIGVVPGSENGTRSNFTTAQKDLGKTLENNEENSIKEGSQVEVFKDEVGYKSAWFSANVLSMKDEKAYVCYTELLSDEGSEKLKEWVDLEGEGGKAPRIRTPHPMTAMKFEGTRKRRRTAMGDYTWSVGDRVDAWMQDGWWEGVVTERSKNDDTSLTVHFPAQGETSVLRAWCLRPSLTWKEGKWVEWSSLDQNKHFSQEGDTPQEKRQKLGGPATESKAKDKVSENVSNMDIGKHEESQLVNLSTHDKVFNIGKNTRDENKTDTLRTLRKGLQKEGSKVIFGVPKPGKKRKFMEVSKHYIAEKSGSNKVVESNNTTKFSKYSIPQRSGSRAWNNSSKLDSKEKKAAEPKPKIPKLGKPQTYPTRTGNRKENVSHDVLLTDHVEHMKGSVGNDEKQMEVGSEGQFVFSSEAISSDSKKLSSSNAKFEQANKGKLAPAGGKLDKIEECDKVDDGNSGKLASDVEPTRRSNRRIQPTSRLLEGLQSSLVIPKLPAVSHDKGHRSQAKSASSSRGTNRG